MARSGMFKEPEEVEVRDPRRQQEKREEAAWWAGFYHGVDETESALNDAVVGGVLPDPDRMARDLTKIREGLPE